MTAFTKRIEFTLDSASNLETKLNTYFNAYDFTLENQEDGSFLFYKKGSLMDGWNFNPLNWKSAINVKLVSKKTVSVNAEFNGNGTITPFGFKPLYESFIANFEQFLVKNQEFKLPNAQQINQAKKKLALYFGLLFLGIVASSLIASYVSETTGNQIAGMITIAAGALLALKLLNLELDKRNEL